MEMQFKNEIDKLADIVVWADNWIGKLKSCLTEEEFAEDEEVKVFEAVRKSVLDAMTRHTVYTNALNKDIADKAAKIELLEKEIEGRKGGYWALKEKYDLMTASEEGLVKTCNSKNEEIEKLKKSFNALKEEMTTRYITIETHNSICETYDNKVAELEKELADCKVKIRHQKENLDGINKTLEIRTKENERLIAVKKNQDKEIEAHESENARLSEKILELKKHNSDLIGAIADKNEQISNLTDLNADLRKGIVGKDNVLMSRTLYNSMTEENERLNKKVMGMDDTITELSHDIDNYKSWNASLHKDIKELKKNKEDDHGRAGFKRYIEYLIEEEERAVPERFKERLNKEITEIFTKEEETEIKGNGRTNSGRYPWGAKVNDIPCGSDSIE